LLQSVALRASDVFGAGFTFDDRFSNVVVIG
jgi:hypothetical protein